MENRPALLETTKPQPKEKTLFDNEESPLELHQDLRSFLAGEVSNLVSGAQYVGLMGKLVDAACNRV